MRALISELLDATHIETGTLSVAPEPSDLALLVDQARRTFLSSGRRHPVQVDLPAELPRVLADRQRIVQVLGNLLSNAGRHSPESSTIRVAAERLLHLFRKFARSGLENRELGVGAGLGLAISKGLVEAHGGRIWAESAGAGLGTRFTFTIPVAAEAVDDLTPPPTGQPGRPRLTGRPEPHVLVVDDDPQALRYMRSILKDAGYVPLVTGDPNELPDLLQTHQPDLVLLDLLLPGPDGIELLERLPALADRPVILLFGYGRDETMARALEAGAADYICSASTTFAAWRRPFLPVPVVVDRDQQR